MFSKGFKRLFVMVCIMSFTIALTACGGKDEKETTDVSDKTQSATINVITREDGSGTRGAFTEIVGLIEKDASGNETDMTYTEAVVQNSTDAVMTATANDESAIGYISLGSLNDTVKALKIGGVEASAEDITNGSYPIARPFNIVYKDGVTPEVQDFLNFIASSEGQKVVEEEGYVKNKDAKPYQGTNNTASITIAGSTSVTPLMEKLVEAYKALNPDFKADIQSTGSSSGIQAAIDGSAQIGMASRELKDDEASKLKKEVIAMDGIAIITNKANQVSDLSMEQVKNIFSGKLTDWAEVNGK